jgi:hypothetical protein
MDTQESILDPPGIIKLRIDKGPEAFDSLLFAYDGESLTIEIFRTKDGGGYAIVDAMRIDLRCPTCCHPRPPA